MFYSGVTPPPMPGASETLADDPAARAAQEARRRRHRLDAVPLQLPQAAPALGITVHWDYFGWPVLVALHWDDVPRVVALRVLLAPPQLEAEVSLGCSVLSMALKRYGGAQCLLDAGMDFGHHPVLARAAELERNAACIITEARQVLADRLAREAIEQREAGR
ncbi:hypothetical protein [Ferrovibrio sp.]|uniref:hypothetical protein n=1 Tax=Ferrovibrio sp. TaxID=1917215 RepID=UPI003D14B572